VTSVATTSGALNPKGVKTTLVVLSSKAQLFDMAGLQNLIQHAYPNSAVFFISTSGDAMGVEAPKHVDLLIDFTPPGARQGMLFAWSLRNRSTRAVGRNSGLFFRSKRYDQIYNEAADADCPRDYLDSERHAQRKVLELAGVPVVRQGGVTADRSKEIALDLPPMQRG
jgi:hypothetical protein